MSDALPTARTTLRASYVRVLVWFKACRHQSDADLHGLVASGHGACRGRAGKKERAAAMGTDGPKVGVSPAGVCPQGASSLRRPASRCDVEMPHQRIQRLHAGGPRPVSPGGA
jgi:hypothetical protein